jgi:hypothetical protein
MMNRVEFNRIASKIMEDTKYSSRAGDIVDHPDHQKLIEAGDIIIKYILQDIQKEPAHWFLTLYLLTGESVIKEEHRGMVPEMTEDWLEWGREKGYIPNKP